MLVTSLRVSFVIILFLCKKKFDRSNVWCYNCQKYERFANEFYANKNNSQEDEAKLVRQENDSENTILMLTIKEVEYGDQ